MIGVVVVCHGELAPALISTAESIVGTLPLCRAITLGYNESGEVLRGRIEEAIAQTDDGDGVLLLTDMFGGTPANLSLTFLENERVEVLTGVNLPMVIKVFGARAEGLGLADAATALRESGRKNIARAADLITGRDRDKGARA